MPLLPISASSIVYGSNDAGRTVHTGARSAAVRRAMAHCAQALHLAPHRVVGGHKLCSAAYVEGHLGADNRLYLLDLARAFPPESPLDVPHLRGAAAVNTVEHKNSGTSSSASSASAFSASASPPPPPPPPPPTPPASGSVGSGVFFRLLRPELLQLWKQHSARNPPLSPDACTNFCRGQPDTQRHNQAVRDATQFMVCRWLCYGLALND
jgi:hypothetical protein